MVGVSDWFEGECCGLKRGELRLAVGRSESEPIWEGLSCVELWARRPSVEA